MSLPLVVIVVLAQPASPGADPALEGMVEATTEGLPSLGARVSF